MVLQQVERLAVDPLGLVSCKESSLSKNCTSRVIYTMTGASRLQQMEHFATNQLQSIVPNGLMQKVRISGKVLELSILYSILSYITTTFCAPVHPSLSSLGHIHKKATIHLKLIKFHKKNPNSIPLSRASIIAFVKSLCCFWQTPVTKRAEKIYFKENNQVNKQMIQAQQKKKKFHNFSHEQLPMV